MRCNTCSPGSFALVGATSCTNCLGSGVGVAGCDLKNGRTTAWSVSLQSHFSTGFERKANETVFSSIVMLDSDSLLILLITRALVRAVPLDPTL